MKLKKGKPKVEYRRHGIIYGSPQQEHSEDPEDHVSDKELEDVLGEQDDDDDLLDDPDDDFGGDEEPVNVGAGEPVVENTPATVSITPPQPMQPMSAVSTSSMQPIIPTPMNDTTLRTEAEDAARRAVERVLSDQAETRLFDAVAIEPVTLDARFVITITAADVDILRKQWQEYNTALVAVGSTKIPFSMFLARRLHLCRSYDAVRAVYLNDSERQYVEELFDTTVFSGQQLVNEIDRRIRPIIEYTNGEPLRLRPINPNLIERVPSWFPDKTPADAISDFIMEAADARM